MINGTEDISFAYDTVSGGDGGFLTVGAENKFGNRGQSRLLRRHGHGPELRPAISVSPAPPGLPGETKTITYTAKGVSTGPWTNCAELKASTVFGITTACATGEVTRKPIP